MLFLCTNDNLKSVDEQENLRNEDLLEEDDNSDIEYSAPPEERSLIESDE